MSKEVNIRGLDFKVLITQDQIQQRVKELAAEISNDYFAQEPPVLLIVMNGAFRFASDIVAQLNNEWETAFIQISTYEGMKSTAPKIVYQGPSLNGRPVLVLEDIVDTGQTLKYLLNHELMQELESVKIASLLFKPSSYKSDYLLNYLGFSVESKFVLGYGLDYHGLGRGLNDIYQIKD